MAQGQHKTHGYCDSLTELAYSNSGREKIKTLKLNGKSGQYCLLELVEIKYPNLSTYFYH